MNSFVLIMIVNILCDNTDVNMSCLIVIIVQTVSLIRLLCLLKKSADKAALDKIFKDLDANADGSVDFQEYITLVACITMLCNDFFQKK